MTLTLNGETLRPSSRVPQALRFPVPWLTLASCAALMAYVDGFAQVGLQGAVGSIERAQGPFVLWLQTSTLWLPVHVLAVFGALWLGHRKWGGLASSRAAFWKTAALIVLAGTVVALAGTIVSGISDLQLQFAQLQQIKASHLRAGAPHAENCTWACPAERDTVWVHLRSLAVITPVFLVANLVLVGWVMALRGGRSPRRA